MFSLLANPNVRRARHPSETNSECGSQRRRPRRPTRPFSVAPSTAHLLAFPRLWVALTDSSPFHHLLITFIVPREWIRSGALHPSTKRLHCPATQLCHEEPRSS